MYISCPHCLSAEPGGASTAGQGTRAPVRLGQKSQKLLRTDVMQALFIKGRRGCGPGGAQGGHTEATADKIPNDCALGPRGLNGEPLTLSFPRPVVTHQSRAVRQVWTQVDSFGYSADTCAWAPSIHS